MTERSPKRGFAARPGDPAAWVRAPEPSTTRTPNAACTARLTIDVTPARRGGIKIAAFQRDVSPTFATRPRFWKFRTCSAVTGAKARAAVTLSVPGNE
jgi:hypothetical protein